MSNVFSRVDNQIRQMNKGELATFTINQYGQDDMASLYHFLTVDKFLVDLIEVVENKYPISITIRRK